MTCLSYERALLVCYGSLTGLYITFDCLLYFAISSLAANLLIGIGSKNYTGRLH